jgi:NitT/TauT family transport system ATP-binding protein
MSALNDTSLSIRGLNYSLFDRKDHSWQILDDINLAVKRGEFVSIVGPSGCGKSTLLNFIANLLPIQSGAIEVFGKPIEGFDTRLGYVFQQHALLPWRTIIENVELPLELRGETKALRRQKSLEALAAMGLAGFENHYPSEISGGMRQRVSLARTLVSEPEFILMDEPFGALDAQTKILIQDVFIKYWEQHRRGVLFVTHDISEAIALSDRVIVMTARPGRVFADHTIDLPRPRRVDALRTDPKFAAYYDLLWSQLRNETKSAEQVLQ